MNISQSHKPGSGCLVHFVRLTTALLKTKKFKKVHEATNHERRRSTDWQLFLLLTQSRSSSGRVCPFVHLPRNLSRNRRWRWLHRPTPECIGGSSSHTRPRPIVEWRRVASRRLYTALPRITLLCTNVAQHVQSRELTWCHSLRGHEALKPQFGLTGLSAFRPMSHLRTRTTNHTHTKKIKIGPMA